jgi:hypothetical protein
VAFFQHRHTCVEATVRYAAELGYDRGAEAVMFAGLPKMRYFLHRHSW